MKILKYIINNALDFLPLIIFLQISGRDSVVGELSWLLAFEITAVVSLVHIAILIFRKRIANRVSLGIDLYFLIVGLASYFSIGSILFFFKGAKEFGMLIPICVVGVVTTFLSKNGFVGYSCGGKNVRLYSIYLLSVAAVALIISFIFIGNHFFAGVLPICLLIISNKILLGQLKNNKI